MKLQYDLYYIKHRSLALDVVILVRTAVDMLLRRGRAGSRGSRRVIAERVPSAARSILGCSPLEA